MSLRTSMEMAAVAVTLTLVACVVDACSDDFRSPDATPAPPRPLVSFRLRFVPERGPVTGARSVQTRDPTDPERLITSLVVDGVSEAIDGRPGEAIDVLVVVSDHGSVIRRITVPTTSETTIDVDVPDGAVEMATLTATVAGGAQREAAGRDLYLAYVVPRQGAVCTTVGGVVRSLWVGGRPVWHLPLHGLVRLRVFADAPSTITEEDYLDESTARRIDLASGEVFNLGTIEPTQIPLLLRARLIPPPGVAWRAAETHVGVCVEDPAGGRITSMDVGGIDVLRGLVEVRSFAKVSRVKIDVDVGSALAGQSDWLDAGTADARIPLRIRATARGTLWGRSSLISDATRVWLAGGDSGAVLERSGREFEFTVDRPGSFEIVACEPFGQPHVLRRFHPMDPLAWSEPFPHEALRVRDQAWDLRMLRVTVPPNVDGSGTVTVSIACTQADPIDHALLVTGPIDMPFPVYLPPRDDALVTIRAVGCADLTTAASALPVAVGLAASGAAQPGK